MPDFALHAIDPTAARAEVVELEGLLLANPILKEADFREFVRARPHASALIGYYNLDVKRIDLLAYEYPLFGDFRCDLAIADSVTRACTFVEFEDAGPRSLFVKHGDKSTREWSPRIDHGYSQVIDWFYKLQDMTNTASMEARFGKRAIDLYRLAGCWPRPVPERWRTRSVAMAARARDRQFQENCLCHL